MTRQTTPSFKSSFAGPETSNALITLLTLTDPSTGEIFRFCNDSVDVPIGPDGQSFLAYPFDFTYPTDEDNKVSSAQLSLTNVDRTIIDNLRLNNRPLTVRIDAVLSDDFTTPVATWQGYDWKALEWDATAISGTLTLESFLNEPYPRKLMGGLTNPGLFYG